MKSKKIFGLFIFIAVMLCLSGAAFAEGDAPKVDTGDTTFNILSTVLVFIMTPGLAFFYGGMVRKKNVLNTMMSSFVIIAIVSIQWVLIGYTLAFGPDKGHIIGGLDWLGFNTVGGDPNAAYAATIPHASFAMFQMMFAIITPALITGALAERMRFPALVIFVTLWSFLVYDPLAHWVWGVGGWLRNLGALDFAGGTVVHISSGISGLVACIMLGKRKKSSGMVPHNIPFVLLGAALLWFGWFGFNAGSALSANGAALNAFVTTNTAAAAATLSWMLIEYFHHGKATILGAATGAVIGLVAITPGAGFVTPMYSIIIGLLVSPICYFAITVIKSKFGYDDALDAFGCHGIGGIWGALATGIFANYGGAKGLISGNPMQLLYQLVAVVVTIALAVIMTFLILKVTSLFTKIRVSERDEEDGLDIVEHGEDAYPDFASEQPVVL